MLWLDALAIRCADVVVVDTVEHAAMLAPGQRRKAEVVAGVRNGVISLEEACRRYKLSIEEFLSWQRLIESHGLAGLRATRLQDYRPAGKSE